jgi:type IV secretory pathway TraG/TraD family ATPase VirD4
MVIMDGSDNVKIDVIAGTEIQKGESLIRSIVRDPSAHKYVIQGTKGAKWEFDDEAVLQKHILILGAIGSGKSNSLYHIISEIRKSMSSDDVMVVFDTKGDYLKEFYADGDSVIGIDRTGPYSYVNWNLFEDIRIEEEGLRVLAADEIISTFFQSSMEKSINPFFPKAARDVVLAVVMAILEEIIEPSNLDLKRALFGSREELISKLKSKKDWSWVLSYIPENSQGSGVFGEIYANMRPLLQDPFGQAGNFSIRKFVRERGGKALFFEYSLNTSMVLKPLFSTLYDLAIKEVLSNKVLKGRTFFVIDEFSLLPYLQYIENGINFGRDRGARFVIAAQNMNQIVDIYGEFRGKSIVSGVGTLISFVLYDKLSREMVSNRYGQNLKNVLVMSRKREEGYKGQVMVSNVVEDSDISTLGVGESLILPPVPPPFRFKWEKYIPKKPNITIKAGNTCR